MNKITNQDSLNQSLEEDGVLSVNKSYVLKPFVHQVGGHNVFLTFQNSSIICKPFHLHEYHFYKNMGHKLASFIPNFHGIAKVKRVVRQRLGNVSIRYTATIVDEDQLIPDDVKSVESLIRSDRKISLSDVKNADDNHNHNHNQQQQCNNLKSDPLDDFGNFSRSKIDIFNESNNIAESAIIEGGNMLNSSDSSNNYECNMTDKRWIMEAKKRFDQKWIKYDYDSKKFILLENVVFRFVHPCVLDLKVGFRAHGDDTKPDKLIRKIMRCRDTTSSMCGLRLCGMQVYQPMHKSDSETNFYNGYLFYDKYHGRTLDVNGLKKHLQEYLSNGEIYRKPIILFFISKLKILAEAIRTCDSLRLFAASLLVTYDGDWADSITNKSDSEIQNDNDGIDKHVDVRLIDFAQTSFVGTSDEDFLNCVRNHLPEDLSGNHSVNSDKLCYEGPDRQFLIGLENLVWFFEEIYKQIE